jgi:hypothetical protein
LRWISDKTTYCEPKNDFYKKIMSSIELEATEGLKGETMRMGDERSLQAVAMGSSMQRGKYV